MTDASGVPTSPDNIPTYNTSADPPSGLGFNTAMAQIQAIITNLKAGTLASGKILASALAGIIPTANLGSGAASSSVFLRGDQTWAAAGVKTTVSTWAGGPPGSPADTDIWIATNVDGNGLRWQFMYDLANTRWRFIGGAPWQAIDTSGFAVSNTGGTFVTKLTITPGRAGGFELVSGGFGAICSAGGAGSFQNDVGIAGVAQGNLGYTSVSASFQFTVPAITYGTLVITAGQGINLMYSSNQTATGGFMTMAIVPVYIT